ncbi:MULTISPECIES: protein kinase [unclassified Streptomyces]|uniref:protein kinase domain-containing protein n=1 Tax=unclassified Streptomyces TaxID=2593676 RepID=UPI0006F6FD51|nr:MULTISPECIES: protein kinase [unclassified Streptomyces]KQX49544.1 serine/threonine protein kinase [Streptomyces sp. Root1304]KRA79163.1 serine/threonine protein kinase [Streptomyces sp. Root66D1]
MAPESGAGGGVPDSAAESWGVGGVVGDGRYRLTHRLGRGGMAEVFAAEDVRLGRTVAVKLLRADLAEDPVSKARFTREAQSVAGLNHHAIVAVYDSGEDLVAGRPVPYIVMELVEGRTIRDLLLSAEAPGPEQALIIVSGVLEALAYSHQHGIVHRDIKPANVIITHGGAVKVMDFGIARALHGAQSTMTQTGMVMGTPQYLSPEQALGKAVDHRSDLYATGCLLYELLALRPPFTGETPLSVVYQHVQDAPIPPSDVTHSVPPELDGLVMRSLAKDPDDRFQSAEEMRGLIQYGLQMLQQQGGHTGTWNTGPVEMHEGGHTPVGGMAATTAMGHPTHGETAQGPILPPQNPEDGGYGGYDGGTGGTGGYGQDGYGPPGGGKGGRGKVWLFAALAVIAVVTGVVFAIQAAQKHEPTGGITPTVTNSPSSPTTEPTPTDEPSEEQSTDQGGSDGGSTQQPWPPPTTRQPTNEPTKTLEPTDEPSKTTEPPTDPTGEPTKTTEPPTEPTGETTTASPDPTGGNGNPDTPPTGNGAESG